MNILKTGNLILLSVFFISCSNLPTGEEPASLDEIMNYESEDFISAFFNSSFLHSHLDEEEQIGLSLTGLILSDNKGLSRLLKLKTKKITSYNVKYQTSHPYTENTGVTASGLLLIPDNIPQPMPVIVYHRASLLSKESAPSLIPASMLALDPITDERASMMLLALQGYIVIVPDYTGYGASDNIPHPYLHKKSVTKTSLDMLFSVTKSLTEKGIFFEKEIFIMGYSQGGHGAMAFAEGLQKLPNQEFSVKALAVGGGPYDIPETTKELLNQESLTPLTAALFMKSYSYIYNWDLDTMLKQDSHQNIIESLFEYENTIDQANKLPNQTKLLFHPEFIENVNIGGNKEIQKNLEENSVYQWSPTFPVLLFHVRDDNIVPYRNSRLAYDYFRNSSSSSVTTQDCNFRQFNSILRAVKKLKQNSRIQMPKPDHINCTFIFLLSASDYISHF